MPDIAVLVFRAYGVRNPLANNEQLALESVLVAFEITTPDEHLPMNRLGLDHHLRQR